MSYAEIWQKLSAVDCSKHIEKKGNLSYLSWAWAWGTLMEHYPQATYRIHKERVQPDGTLECRVSVSIDDCTRMMWLPAMDNRNNAIERPTSRQISDARMRCLVKCISMFGLGHYIYAGEDLPQAPAITEDQLAEFRGLLAKGDPLPFAQFMAGLSEDAQAAAFNSAPSGEKMKLKQSVRDLQKEADAIIGKYVEGIEEAINNEDRVGFLQLAEELNPFTKKWVWSRLTEIQHIQIKQLMEQAA